MTRHHRHLYEDMEPGFKIGATTGCFFGLLVGFIVGIHMPDEPSITKTTERIVYQPYAVTNTVYVPYTNSAPIPRQFVSAIHHHSSSPLPHGWGLPEKNEQDEMKHCGN